VYVARLGVQPHSDCTSGVVEPAVVDLDSNHVRDDSIRDVSSDPRACEGVAGTLRVSQILCSIYYLHRKPGLDGAACAARAERA
jgi:hypothetical protein